MNYYLAIDIGASSGRHIVGWLENGTIQTDEVFRFPNGVSNSNGHLTWDVNALFDNVKSGIKAAFAKYGQIKSLAIDTWGVDYVLLKENVAISPCFSYRDDRTDAAIKEIHKVIPFEELYQKTGIQFQTFNTIYQLFDDLKNGRLNDATDFLMIPEHLNFLLTGIKMHEYTNATTTGLVNSDSKKYDLEIITQLGLPKKLFGKLYNPGTVVGKMLPQLADELGGQTNVVLCASHDTASAVEGIPMEENSPYISSGTWSLLGIKVEKAIKDKESRKANFSNEGGVGYVRYQKNIMGMWVVNRLREELCPEKPFVQITAEAQNSDFSKVVDINAERFLSPKSMVSAFSEAWGGNRPAYKENDYFRCAYLSLAYSYNNALQELGSRCDVQYKKLYIVGGGAKNKFLNDLCEQICNVKVEALPIEASAIGNLKIQMEDKLNV